MFHVAHSQCTQRGNPFSIFNFILFIRECSSMTIVCSTVQGFPRKLVVNEMPYSRVANNVKSSTSSSYHTPESFRWILYSHLNCSCNSKQLNAVCRSISMTWKRVVLTTISGQIWIYCTSKERRTWAWKKKRQIKEKSLAAMAITHSHTHTNTTTTKAAVAKAILHNTHAVCVCVCTSSKFIEESQANRTP